MTEVEHFQGLLPAAAFTDVLWWFGSFDTKDLLLDIGHVLHGTDGWYNSHVSFYQDRQWTDLAVNIKFSRFIISFFAIGVFEREFFASASVIPLDPATIFCIDTLF